MKTLLILYNFLIYCYLFWENMYLSHLLPLISLEKKFVLLITIAEYIFVQVTRHFTASLLNLFSSTSTCAKAVWLPIFTTSKLALHSSTVTLLWNMKVIIVHFFTDLSKAIYERRLSHHTWYNWFPWIWSEIIAWKRREFPFHTAAVIKVLVHNHNERLFSDDWSWWMENLAQTYKC